MTFGSLFTGIGGFDLGLMRAGMKCQWQCEIDEPCREVLKLRFPRIKRYSDVRQMKHGIKKVDLICGGFPCQDISSANFTAKGIEGERSGLWKQFARIIRLVRPRFILVENVAALLFRGIGRVLSDLAKLRYDAEWQMFSGEAIGAPQGRARIFILAYPSGKRCPGNGILQRAITKGAEAEQQERLRTWPGVLECGGARTERVRWVPHGRVLRTVDGIPGRLDRYQQLGNGIIPLIPELIGRELMEAAS